MPPLSRNPLPRKNCACTALFMPAKAAPERSGRDNGKPCLRGSVGSYQSWKAVQFTTNCHSGQFA